MFLVFHDVNPSCPRRAIRGNWSPDENSHFLMSLKQHEVWGEPENLELQVKREEMSTVLRLIIFGLNLQLLGKLLDFPFF